MKKITAFFTACALALLGGNLHADDHTSDGNIVGFVYSFNVTDPGAVVGALTDYWNSPVGKKNPATAILRQHVANGTDPSTHSIAVVYDSLAQIDETNAMNNGTKEMQAFLAKMSSAATLTSEAMFIGTGITSGNADIVPAPGRYTSATSVAVSDPAAYVAAWQAFTGASASDRGATNLFVTNGNGQDATTHVVTISANSMEDLLTPNPDAPEALATFLSDVKDIRTIENRAIYVDLMVFGNN